MTQNSTSNPQRKKIPSWIERLVEATDSRFRVPGTSYRFGYDAILGLVPGIGDLVGLLVGAGVVFAAVRIRASRAVISRMIGNLALDATLGSVPVIGDLFDFFFKANQRNLQLLQDELEEREASAA